MVQTFVKVRVVVLSEDSLEFAGQYTSGTWNAYRNVMIKFALCKRRGKMHFLQGLLMRLVLWNL